MDNEYTLEEIKQWLFMDKEYTLEEIKQKAIYFLDSKHDSNITTFKNYRTSVNYLIYIIRLNNTIFAVINDDNKYDVLNKLKNCLLNGFDYAVESVEDVVGYTEENFKPVNKRVEVKENGVNTHLRRIITFFNNYLYLKIDDPNKFKKCDGDDPKYKALKYDHVKLLIDECSNCWKKEEIATRNATLIRLLFNNALRIREALEITIDDTNFIDYNNETNKAALKEDIENYNIIIHQKGRNNKNKTIAINENMANHIIDYINIKKVPSDYVFSTTQRSTDGKAKPLSRQYFNKDVIKLANFVDERYDTMIPKEDKIYDYNNISEVVKNNSSHVFRHSRAVFLLNEQDINIRVLQQVLRHKSITSTEVYTNNSDKTVDNINMSFNL